MNVKFIKSSPKFFVEHDKLPNVESLVIKQVQNYDGNMYDVVDLEKLDITELNLPTLIKEAVSKVNNLDKDSNILFLDRMVIENVLPGRVDFYADIEVIYQYIPYKVDLIGGGCLIGSNLHIYGVKSISHATLYCYDENLLIYLSDNLDECSRTLTDDECNYLLTNTLK